jgi:hypothetical protein
LIPKPVRAGLTRRQAQFLCDEREEVLYGGAGGGGKSFALLMGAVQYPCSALILRRTFAQMAKSDSILDVAKSWWLTPGSKVRYSDKSKTFRFPGGGTLEFGHMEHLDDRFNYQGAGYRYVAYDELTQFAESQYTYLFSRLRKDVSNPAPLRMRAATNPGGVGHTWVYKRFVDRKNLTRNDEETGYVPAKLVDNPNIDVASYRKSLSKLDPLTRALIEDGNWNAIEGGRFKKSWFKYYEYDSGFYITPGGERFRLADVPVFQTCDPCSTDHGDDWALSTWAVSPKSFLLWIGAEVDKIETPEQIERCQKSYLRWTPQFLGVEAVATQRALGQLLRQSKTPVMVIRDLEPRGQNKLARAVGIINLAYEGRLLLPANPGPDFPMEKLEAQLLSFTGRDGDADDLVDTGSYAAECLVHLSPTTDVPIPHDPNKAKPQQTSPAKPIVGPKSFLPLPRRLG